MLAQNLYDEINSDGSIKYNKKQVLKLLKLLNESKENMSDFLYGKGEIYWKVEKKKDGKFDFANANPCMKRKTRQSRCHRCSIRPRYPCRAWCSRKAMRTDNFRICARFLLRTSQRFSFSEALARCPPREDTTRVRNSACAVQTLFL